MFRRGILLSPRRRYHPPYGNTLYMPLREMSIGTSSNLLDNGGFEDGITGWTPIRATIAEESTIVYAGEKALKITADGAGACYAYFNLESHLTKILGVTVTLSSKVYGLSSNTYSPRMAISLTGGTPFGVNTINADEWRNLLISGKVESTTTVAYIFLYVKSSTEVDTDDVVYFDDLVLTVPQSITPNGLICHPSGCIWTPEGFLFDGVDDLITFESDFIGASACTIMGWIKLNRLTGMAKNIIANNSIVFTVWPTTYGTPNCLALYSDGVKAALSGANTITLNQWHHVAVTRKSDGKATLYINGQPTGTPDQDSGTPAAGVTNVIVGNRLAGDRGFDGTIDDLLVFNRILTPQEIQAHYSMTKWSY